jgi:NAD(P)-dependent dehydrogenase (short-subunit alcohol dehydrogenase family)
MRIEGSVALVTGASRGIGRELVGALIAAGAKRVYAGARKPGTVDTHGGRVIPLELDITNERHLERVADAAPDVNLLLNNAGVFSAFNLLSTTREALEREFATNFYGTLATTRAMLPVIERAGGGAIANVLTVASLASMPPLGGYSATKAAAWSLTQALRGELKRRNIAVHAVFPGPVDTDMTRELTLPKTHPAEVARAVVRGIAAGEEDILPDPMSRHVFEQWLRDPKGVEQQFASM